MTNFRPYEPDQQLLLPPSLRDWIPPDHLVWFISETVDPLDLSEILGGYRDGGQGNLPYHPAMMLKILMRLRALSHRRSCEDERRNHEHTVGRMRRDELGERCIPGSPIWLRTWRSAMV